MLQQEKSGNPAPVPTFMHIYCFYAYTDRSSHTEHMLLQIGQKRHARQKRERAQCNHRNLEV
jgi:hypothetical protein